MSRLQRLAAVSSTLVLVLGLVAAAPRGTAPPAAAPSGSSSDDFRIGAPLGSLRAEGSNLIRIMAGAFDPLESLAPLPAGVSAIDPATLPAERSTYWFVQVAGRDFAGALDAIAAAGAVADTAVRDATYVVRAAPAQIAAVAASPSVRAVVFIQPGWKLPTALGEYEAILEVEGPQVYRVHIYDTEPAPAQVREAIAAIAGTRIVADAGHVLDVAASREQVPAMAAIDAVEWVEIRPTVVPLNQQARWVNDTAVRDLQWAMTDGRLDGSGQTAGVADTGVNYIPDRNGKAHVSFRDCAGGTVEQPTGCELADYTQQVPGTGTTEVPDGDDEDTEPDSVSALLATQHNGTDHRKMAAYFDLGATGPNPSDGSAHGTHVAGSVTGDHGDYGTWDGEDGMAPAARLVHQNIGSPGGGLSTPTDSYLLWQQAYRPRDPRSVERDDGPRSYADTLAGYRPNEDARTHNNSYGLIVPNVSLGSAEAADEFVWEHEDMVIVSSAGNSGPVPFSMGAPSIGKNVVSSGASANGRQPMVSIDSMASFSSHGPTADGRFGVDLATPGQTVISTKGGTADEFHYLQGTSMSGPILTGFATLVRQYFWDGYGPGTGTASDATASGFASGAPDAARAHNPSAALVRATLVNGATRMRGWYTGDDGTNRVQDGQYPSAGQGFGLVNLTDSLYFDDEGGRSTHSAWYHDVWRADGQAFDEAETGSSTEHAIEVAEGEPLSVTLAYTDAPNALIEGTSVRTNDLDLIVWSPDGTPYSGNNFNTRVDPSAEEAETQPGLKTDAVNPVERVIIQEPAPGTWRVEVRAAEVAWGPQGYALAATGLVAAPAGDSGTPGTFGPGAPLQQDVAGEPAISDVRVTPVDDAVAKVTWTTSEPTTGVVTTTVDGEVEDYPDVYNHNGEPEEGDDDPGYDRMEEGPVETSEEYGNKPVVSTSHETLLTGLSPGQTYELTIASTDLAGQSVTTTATFDHADGVFGADAFDMAQLAESATDPATGALGIGANGWGLGTQLYAGESGGSGYLGAFMFRLPGDVDPASITGASVELTSMHDITNHYEANWIGSVDLLPDELDDDWQSNNYETVHNAPADARAYPETGYRRGGQRTYAFEFTCTQLDALKANLAADEGERRAAFRFDAATDVDGIFSQEFGYNRRSRGAEFRPRLVLSTDGSQPRHDCGPDTPAPTITELGVQEVSGDDEPTSRVTVSWQTDVPADSTVLFREVEGTGPFTQVRYPSLVTTHAVTILGLDPSKQYEFVVASSACNGNTTEDDNGGQGYLLFPPEYPTVDDLGEDEFASFWFHGTPADEAQKLAQFGGPTSATFSPEPPDGSGGVQHTTPLANMSFVENPLAAYWTGTVADALELRGPLVFEWYWGGSAPRRASVDVVVFANPDRSDGASAVQPERIVASGTVPVDVSTGPVPSGVSRGSIPVNGGSVSLDAGSELVIQVSGGGLTDTDLEVYYDQDSVPSRFLVPTVTLPGPPDEVPDAGPVPPQPSDGVPGDVSPREASFPSDLDAGTALCGRVVEAPPTGGGDGGSSNGGTGDSGSGEDSSGDGSVEPAGDQRSVRGRGPERACAPDHVPAAGFEDTAGSVHAENIDCIAWYAITKGTGDRDRDGNEEYEPRASVSRAQMASFIARLAVEAGIELPADPPDAFPDDEGSVHEAAIDALAALDLVEGKEDGTYDPTGEVSRAQMASFIARLHARATGTAREPEQDHFEDDEGSVHERSINVLADLRVVRGVGDRDGNGRGEYAPREDVVRGQMASFIAQDLELLAAAGAAHPGGAEVYLEDTSAAAGEELAGVIEANKPVRSVTASGCGLAEQPVEVGDGGRFSVRIPEDQPEGSCELALSVTTRRGFQPGAGQQVTYRFAVEVTSS